MTTYTEVELRCDGVPGDPFGCAQKPLFGRSVELVRREAQEDGWSVALKGNRDLCPDHRNPDRRVGPPPCPRP